MQADDPLLDVLWRDGVFVIDPGGHQFHIHEEHPLVPKSQVKVRFAAATERTLRALAVRMVDELASRDIAYDYVLGIPNSASELGVLVFEQQDIGARLLKVCKTPTGFTFLPESEQVLKEVHKKKRVLLVENATTTGRDAIRAARAARDVGLDVVLCTAFDWDARGTDAWKQATGRSMVVVYDVLDALAYGWQRKYINREHIESAANFVKGARTAFRPW